MKNLLKPCLLAALLCACGGGGHPGSPDLTSKAPADLATPAQPDLAATAKYTLKVTAPANLTGTPFQLAVALYGMLPPAGPPDGGLLYEQNSTIMPGQTLTLSDSVATITHGSYYVYAVLYMVGGGASMFAPKAGVDYVAQSAMTYTFNGQSIDLGALTLTLYTGSGP